MPQDSDICEQTRGTFEAGLFVAEVETPDRAFTRQQPAAHAVPGGKAHIMRPTDRLRRLRHQAARGAARPNVLFGGVYGAVLATSLVAALNRGGARTDALYDAQWIIAAAFASAMAHGYAHTIAKRGSEGHAAVDAARVLADEWPLVAATLPTVILLVGAGLGWWGSSRIEYVAFGTNIALLFGIGLFASRSAGRRRRTAATTGGADALLGFAVVGANAVIK